MGVAMSNRLSRLRPLLPRPFLVRDSRLTLLLLLLLQPLTTSLPTYPCETRLSAVTHTPDALLCLYDLIIIEDKPASRYWAVTFYS